MGVFHLWLTQCSLMPQRRRNLFSSHYVPYQSTSRTELKQANMLQLLGTVVGLLLVIMCFSKGLKEGNKTLKSQLPESSANNKKQKDLSEEDVHLLARILSVGLVDADPNYLQHLKGYRDLRGG